MTRQKQGTDKVHDEAHVRTRLQKDLPHWFFEAGLIQRKYKTGGWKGTLMVVNAIGHLAEAAWHHPDLEISYAEVLVKLQTHSAHGITDKDFELAGRIEQLVSWQPGRDKASALEGTPANDKYTYIKYD